MFNIWTNLVYILVPLGPLQPPFVLLEKYFGNWETHPSFSCSWAVEALDKIKVGSLPLWWASLVTQVEPLEFCLQPPVLFLGREHQTRDWQGLWTSAPSLLCWLPGLSSQKLPGIGLFSKWRWILSVSWELWLSLKEIRDVLPDSTWVSSKPN